MKSSIRAALALGALALASAQASASSVSVTSGSVQPVYQDTPGMFEIVVGGGVTGAEFRLMDTIGDGRTVTYQLWTDTNAGIDAITLGSVVGASWTWTDTGIEAVNLAATYVYRALVSGSQYALVLSEIPSDPGLYAATTQISAVPLPAAAWLFGSAVLGFGALRRKQKAGATSEMALT